MLAACLSSALLGSFMCTLIVLCRRYGLDPGKSTSHFSCICDIDANVYSIDNIAPPVAACLGDLVTLLLLGAVSTINIVLVGTPFPLIFMLLLTAAAVGWTVVTRRNHQVKHLILEGWPPLFAAMIISCGTGIVLDLFVSRYEGFALLAAVISGMSPIYLPVVACFHVFLGLPGNVGSILVSRLSTALHATVIGMAGLPATSTDELSKPPSPPPPTPRLVMITLLCVTFPIEIAFLATLRALGWLRVPFVFMVFSLVFFCVAVSCNFTISSSENLADLFCGLGRSISISCTWSDRVLMEAGS